MVGEHIRALKGGRWNHAIDCGDETVIHLAEDGAAPARVRRSYRPEFVAGAEAVEVVRHRERTFPANEVVARAYSRISDPGLSAIFRDSEAFAGWCVTGRLPPAPPNRAVGVSGVAAAPAPAAPAAAARTSRATRPQGKAKTKAARAAAPRAKKAVAKAKARVTKGAKSGRTATRPSRKGGAKPARKNVRAGRAARRR